MRDAKDSDMIALANKLTQNPQPPLSDEELKTVRQVVKVLEAFSVLGSLGKGVLMFAAAIAAFVIYGRDVLLFIRGG